MAELIIDPYVTLGIDSLMVKTIDIIIRFNRFS